MKVAMKFEIRKVQKEMIPVKMICKCYGFTSSGLSTTVKNKDTINRYSHGHARRQQRSSYAPKCVFSGHKILTILPTVLTWYLPTSIFSTKIKEFLGSKWMEIEEKVKETVVDWLN
jgi:hypothetical protein